MFKWYGDEEINNGFKFLFDIPEYEIVQPEDLYLEVEMSFLPVLELDDKVYSNHHGFETNYNLILLKDNVATFYPQIEMGDISTNQVSHTLNKKEISYTLD